VSELAEVRLFLRVPRPPGQRPRHAPCPVIRLDIRRRPPKDRDALAVWLFARWLRTEACREMRRAATRELKKLLADYPVVAVDVE
jgi:hypothetical protein